MRRGVCRRLIDKRSSSRRQLGRRKSAGPSTRAKSTTRRYLPPVTPEDADDDHRVYTTTTSLAPATAPGRVPPGMPASNDARSPSAGRSIPPRSRSPRTTFYRVHERGEVSPRARRRLPAAALDPRSLPSIPATVLGRENPLHRDLPPRAIRPPRPASTPSTSAARTGTPPVRRAGGSRPSPRPVAHRSRPPLARPGPRGRATSTPSRDLRSKDAQRRKPVRPRFRRRRTSAAEALCASPSPFRLAVAPDARASPPSEASRNAAGLSGGRAPSVDERHPSTSSRDSRLAAAMRRPPPSDGSGRRGGTRDATTLDGTGARRDPRRPTMASLCEGRGSTTRAARSTFSRVARRRVRRGIATLRAVPSKYPERRVDAPVERRRPREDESPPHASTVLASLSSAALADLNHERFAGAARWDTAPATRLARRRSRPSCPRDSLRVRGPRTTRGVRGRTGRAEGPRGPRLLDRRLLRSRTPGSTKPFLTAGTRSDRVPETSSLWTPSAFLPRRCRFDAPLRPRADGWRGGTP